MRKVRVAKQDPVGQPRPPPNSILGDILLESKAGGQSKKMVKVGGEGGRAWSTAPQYHKKEIY